MTLKDVSNGPEWLVWAGFAVFLALSIILLTGHGANLIAGYNTSTKEEKDRYDTKKMCRVVGAGMALITVLIFIMAVWEDVLPASFAGVSMGIVIADCVAILILVNTVCKKK